MLKENKVLRQEARKALEGNWGMAAVATLIYMIIAFGLSSIPYGGIILTLLIGVPISWGLYIIFYDVYHRRGVQLSTLFEGFKSYSRVLGTQLLAGLYTLLWTLLLIVPGIIKAISYAMTPFILRDYPFIAYNDAIEKSMAMMEGHKMKFFLLTLSFIGWYLLCCLTLGIGLLLLYPYIYTSYAAFYEDLKAEAGELGQTQETQQDQATETL